MDYHKNATSFGESLSIYIYKLYDNYVTSWYDNTYIDGSPHHNIFIANTLEMPQSRGKPPAYDCDLMKFNMKLKTKHIKHWHISQNTCTPTLYFQIYITSTLNLVSPNTCYIVCLMARHYFSFNHRKTAGIPPPERHTNCIPVIDQFRKG